MTAPLSYCLGVGGMTKCKTCQHDANWTALNQMPNTLRLAIQATAQRVSEEECQITNGCHHAPTEQK